MADPLSAIGSLAAIVQLTEEALKVGVYLRKLYKDSKHVDKTVDQLGVEVVTLSKTWTTVHAEVGKVITPASGTTGGSVTVYDSSGQLWRCICDQVQHCWQTLKELQEIVDAIGTTRGNIVTQVKRQLRVDGRQSAISSIRQRIGLHMSSIQVILLLINIEVSHLAPGHANDELLTKLNNVETMVQDLVQQGAPAPDGIAAASQVNDAASLIACAEQVIHSGASLYNASVADGSVAGGYRLPERTQWTTTWLRDISAIRNPDMAESTNGSSPATSISSRSQVDLLRSEDSSSRSIAPPSSHSQQIPEDDEHYIVHAMLKLGLQEGREAVQNMQWSAADEFLKESLSLLSQLPERSRAAYDVIELQYLLVVCAFHGGEDIEITQEALSSLVQRMPQTDRQRTTICDATLLQARLFLRIDDYDQARLSCQSVSDARRRFLGEESTAYHEALALLARIYRLLDNPRSARFVELIIPDSSRTAALAYADQITSADAAIISKTSSTWFPEVVRLFFDYEVPKLSELDLWRKPEVPRVKELEGYGGWVRSVTFSPDSRLVATASRDQMYKLWDTSTGKIVHTFQHSLSVWCCAFSPDGRFLASGSIGRTISLWDTGTYAKVRQLGTVRPDNAHGVSTTVLSIAFSPDGKSLVSAGADGAIRLWNTGSGEIYREILGHTSTVSGVAFSPNGGLIASGSWDLTIRLWNANTGSAMAKFEGHTSYVCCIAFSPDGRILVSGSGDETIRVWDLSISAELKTLKGHSDKVWAVAFSPDGWTLASASFDGTVRLWDVATWTETSRIDGGGGRCESVAFSPDGRLLAWSNGRGHVTVWDRETPVP